jgi:hypothetical protein
MPDLLTFSTADWLQFATKVALAYVFLLWAVIIIWVARDVVARTKNLFFQTFALLLVTFLNFFGLLLYLILRPQKTLAERYYEDLEQKTLATSDDLCTGCGREVGLNFRFCPGCGAEARVPCHHCKKLIGKLWTACAYCGTTVQEEKKKK